MKTKFFKTGLPIVAFITAITFAFASQGSSESPQVDEYRWTGSVCERVVVGCNNIPSTLCNVGGQIYAKSGTQNCGTMLFHTPTP